MVPAFDPLKENLNKKIYCANCINCKLIRHYTNDGKYMLRIRCSAGKWRKKLGDEKLHKYFTIARRFMDHCDTYTPMGDLKSYMKELRVNLPTKDEVYDSA